MSEANGSQEVARAILNRYVRDAGAALGDSLQAILLTGSLATGSYVPGPGGIDQITILRDSASDPDLERVVRCIEEAMEAHGRAVNLASVVYRRRDLDRRGRMDQLRASAP